MSKTQIEIERKYIIEKPEISKMKSLPEYTESEILQIYLSSEPNTTHRVRARASNGKTVYTETKKIRIDKMSSHETEGEIDKERFEALSQSIKNGSRPLHKKRHTFSYKGQTFEIDIYPEWKHTAIMETELKTRADAPEIPEFIKIIEEVTGKYEYSNLAMSISFPKEK